MIGKWVDGGNDRETEMEGETEIDEEEHVKFAKRITNGNVEIKSVP